MPIPALLAAVAFVVLFAMWVVLPGRIKAKHEAAAAYETAEE